eukprot:CAMPEP_0119125356 /NCGR_PEP_ID=MMETSP1310-20130426/4662_1 /TAXON_ID=464262 /ORGANISM="Genus nov. species nov., Strain RCC2339" /LENGTH=72 /DNA_ID=CAMNT_0007115417 /DNA_START=260 /DNA_END=479 /DNA_ORIENTATION=-
MTCGGDAKVCRAQQPGVVRRLEPERYDVAEPQQGAHRRDAAQVTLLLGALSRNCKQDMPQHPGVRPSPPPAL